MVHTGNLPLLRSQVSAVLTPWYCRFPMPPIEISDKPYEDSPKGIVGAFLVVPLNEQPPESWIQGFKNPVPTENPAAAFVDSTFRMPIIGPLRSNVGRYLESFKEAIAEANARFAKRETESAEVHERARNQARQEKKQFDGELDGWWGENQPSST